MIHFFRRIRKQLADDNKPIKYFRYAIGEIVLVVIGILIALSINNWNEARKNQQESIVFLQNLQIDLEKDFKQISKVIDIQTRRFQFLDSLIKATRNKLPIAETDGNENMETGRNETFFPVVGTYKSAQENGVINNLRNKKLKIAIINLYEHHYVRLGYNGELNDQRLEAVEWESRAYINHDVLEFNFNRLALKDSNFITQIGYLNKFTNIYKSRAEDIKAAMKDILTMLKNELVSQ